MKEKQSTTKALKPIKRSRGDNNEQRAARIVKGNRPGVEAAIEADGLRDLPPEVLSPNAVTLMDAGPDQCRWPIGEPGTKEFRFCGNRGYPWCAHHARIARGSSGPRPHLRAGTRRRWA